MSAQRKNAVKTRGKPFERGNPGRPLGARHRVTRAVEALLEGQHEALTKKAIDKALEGDSVALRLCLDRLCPPRRDAPISIQLPPVRTAADAVEASAAVLAAVAAGEVTPDEGGRIMALLVSHKSIVEVGDLEARVVALEERAGK
jgi:multidrug efflux pump subunit AcrA (membrane-fusion protein)